jgi:hypothetical protein
LGAFVQKTGITYVSECSQYGAKLLIISNHAWQEFSRIFVRAVELERIKVEFKYTGENLFVTPLEPGDTSASIEVSND